MQPVKIEDKIKFAVIGCGHIGKRHAAMITNNKECELVALCDTRCREELNIEEYTVPYFSSIGDLFSSGISMNVVCIATPNGLHEEHALKVLGAGLHVVIEKPMALTTEGCKRIIDEAAKQGRQVFCVMQNRFSAPAVWLKDIVEKKRLGEIYMVQVNCYWNRDERYYSRGSWHGTTDMDGGVLFTQFSHFIDTVLWVFGDINNISARFANFKHQQITAFDDTGLVNFDIVKGGMGCFNFSTAVWDQNLESSITVIAENGTVKIGGQYMNEVEYCDIKDYIMPQLAAAESNNHKFIIENVVNVLKHNTGDTVTAAAGLKVIETIESIYGVS